MEKVCKERIGNTGKCKAAQVRGRAPKSTSRVMEKSLITANNSRRNSRVISGMIVAAESRRETRKVRIYRTWRFFKKRFL